MGTTIEMGDIVKNLIILIILSNDAENRSLDSEIDVFGNQDDFAFSMIFDQRQSGSQNRVIRKVTREVLRKGRNQFVDLKEKPPTGRNIVDSCIF